MLLLKIEVKSNNETAADVLATPTDDPPSSSTTNANEAARRGLYAHLVQNSPLGRVSSACKRNGGQGGDRRELREMFSNRGKFSRTGTLTALRPASAVAPAANRHATSHARIGSFPSCSKRSQPLPLLLIYRLTPCVHCICLTAVTAASPSSQPMCVVQRTSHKVRTQTFPSPINLRPARRPVAFTTNAPNRAQPAFLVQSKPKTSSFAPMPQHCLPLHSTSLPLS